MSGVKSFFGGDKPDRIGIGKLIRKFPIAQEQIFGGAPETSTGFSTFNPRTGLFSADPTGRDLQLGALERFQESQGGLREDLLSNRQAFEDAQVNPFLRQVAATRGALQRQIGRTGVRGTFAQRPLQSLDLEAAQRETDIRADATDRFINAVNAMDAAMLKAESGTGMQIFDQELKALGFSQSAVDNLIRYAANLTTQSGSTGASSAAQRDALALERQRDIIGGIGSVVSGFV